MQFMSPYWGNKEKFDLLCRWILMHSIFYYILDNSVVSDEMFDNNCKQLVKGIKKDPETFKECRYYNLFYDFDGSTGFHLFGRLNKKQQKEKLAEARWTLISLKEYKDENKNN